MTRPARTRKPVEQPAEWRHRARMREVRSLDRQISWRSTRRAAVLTDALDARRKLTARFGRPLPNDPTGILYDILERVVVEADGGWRWLGSTNNRGLATVRGVAGDATSEVSVRRYLAVSFEVIDAGFEGILYPDRASRRCGYVDVNPFRTTLRQFADGVRRGNPTRFERPAPRVAAE